MEYIVNWDKAEICIVKGNKNQCRSDFAMKLIAMVEAGPLTGYQAKVMRQVDMKSRYFPPI